MDSLSKPRAVNINEKEIRLEIIKSNSKTIQELTKKKLNMGDLSISRFEEISKLMANGMA